MSWKFEFEKYTHTLSPEKRKSMTIEDWFKLGYQAAEQQHKRSLQNYDPVYNPHGEIIV